MVRYLAGCLAATLLVGTVFAAPVIWAGHLTGATTLPEEMGLLQNDYPSLIAEPFNQRAVREVVDKLIKRDASVT